MAGGVFDPSTRRETRLYQELFRDAGNVPVYRELPYVLVSYDGDPKQYLEPLPPADQVKLLDGSGDPIVARADGMGAIVGFQFFTKRPFEVFAYNDVDASGIGQLP
jgi:hypothetical protein